jgi:hypothetical protein
MKKLIDFINGGSVEFGKKYYLNDFDCNDIKNYFIFYDDEFYIGFTTHENNKEVDQDVLQIRDDSTNFTKLTNKTWKGFKTTCKLFGIEVDDKYKFF